MTFTRSLVLARALVFVVSFFFSFFFFNDTATTEIYTLSLHDALPISAGPRLVIRPRRSDSPDWTCRDRKSTRLNSSHMSISYAVFCLKKKKNHKLILCHNLKNNHEVNMIKKTSEK